MEAWAKDIFDFPIIMRIGWSMQPGGVRDPERQVHHHGESIQWNDVGDLEEPGWGCQFQPQLYERRRRQSDLRRDRNQWQPAVDDPERRDLEQPGESCRGAIFGS